MWNLVPDFGSLIAGGIAEQRGSHNRGTTVPNGAICQQKAGNYFREGHKMD